VRLQLNLVHSLAFSNGKRRFEDAHLTTWLIA